MHTKLTIPKLVFLEGKIQFFCNMATFLKWSQQMQTDAFFKSYDV